MGWNFSDIPDQSGLTFLITGATSGLGLESAKAIAAAGGDVILAGRSADRLAAAQRLIPQQTRTLIVDLADLTSVREAADSVEHLDILMNNAGIMAPPLGRTADGFETQIGTNHLGHFALTGLLLPKMPVDSEKSRVVTVSSMMHHRGAIDLTDLNYEHRGYQAWSAYGQSKLANLMFASELDRKARQASWALRSVAAHPGFSSTNLQFAGPSMAHNPVGRLGTKLMNLLLAQSAESGARPQVYAATMPDVHGGDYYGPKDLRETRGDPVKVGRSKAAQDQAVAAKLWDLSEELTGVHYPTSAPNSSTS